MLVYQGMSGDIMRVLDTLDPPFFSVVTLAIVGLMLCVRSQSTYSFRPAANVSRVLLGAQSLTLTIVIEHKKEGCAALDPCDRRIGTS